MIDLVKLSSEICVSDIGGFVGFSCNIMIVYPLSLTYWTIAAISCGASLISNENWMVLWWSWEAVCRSMQKLQDIVLDHDIELTLVSSSGAFRDRNSAPLGTVKHRRRRQRKRNLWAWRQKKSGGNSATAMLLLFVMMMTMMIMLGDPDEDLDGGDGDGKVY